jgi:hypothetical protein
LTAQSCGDVAKWCCFPDEEEDAVLETVPLVLPPGAQQLEINAESTQAGYIRVSVIMAGSGSTERVGKGALLGYASVTGDSTSHQVSHFAGISQTRLAYTAAILRLLFTLLCVLFTI